MDERTLNDLLECSVCLERLDTSSKVLPCQHTFCRKCLEVIISSRQELRCPECRVLVDVKIDELPPNVLLMRILEGLKNSTQNQNNTVKSPRKNGSAGNANTNENPKGMMNEQTPVKGSVIQSASNRQIVPHAFALYDFLSKEQGDLNFKKGDVILLKRKLDSNWFVGEVNGREGSFPTNYVQIIVPLPVPQCVALYDFKMGPNEEEGCLNFKKGALIQVLRRVDHNWAEGRIGSCIGIFPIAFVEMNTLAKQLLDVGSNFSGITPRILPPIPYDNSSSETSSTQTTSPNSTCSSNTSSNSIPSSPSSNPVSPQNQANVKYRDLKEKRHSLNAITASANLSVIQSNRHSAEILSLPDTNEFCNSDDMQLQTGGSGGAPTNRSQDAGQQRQYVQQPQQQQVSRVNVLKSNSQQAVPTLPWAYVALYPYKPKKNDEIELKKGCVYFVTERCLDGWYKGKNWADKSGVFPGNYVTPLRNRDQQQLMHQRKVKQNPNQAPQIISTSQAASSQNNHNYTNLPGHHPPELPPRNSTSPSGSAWSKPLTQHVETFFNRTKNSSAHPRDNKSPSVSNTITKNSSNSVTGREDTGHQQSSQGNVPKEKEKKELASSAVSLMKRLTNIKRSKSPTHNQFTYSMDNPVFEDGTGVVPSSSKQNLTMFHPVHVRSGSCPSQLLQSLPVDFSGATGSGDLNSAFSSQRVKGHKDRPSIHCLRQQSEGGQSGRSRTHTEQNDSNGINQPPTNNGPKSNSQIPSQQVQQSAGNVAVHHRKTQSLDANTISAQINGNPANTKSHTAHKERFRCIVTYPPNSEMELELNVGDIVFVHRKQKNGWYKGTHSRTNKTGLFPASFVEPDI